MSRNAPNDFAATLALSRVVRLIEVIIVSFTVYKIAALFA